MLDTAGRAPAATARSPERADAALLLGGSVASALAGSAGAFCGLGFAPRVGIDDALITEIYARNIAAGLGYVYNVGGERVEGSTSLVWTLLAAICAKVTSSPGGLLLLLGFVFAVWTVYLGALIARKLAETAGAGVRLTVGVYFVVMACTPMFFAWTVLSLMDVAVWSLLFVALAWRSVMLLEVERPRASSIAALSALAGLIVLTRPEGIAVALGGLVVTAVLRAVRTGPAGAARALLPVAPALLCAVLVYVGATAARVAYFGQPFPNTYYAKVSANHLADIVVGARYVAKFAMQHVLLAAALVVLPAVGLVQRRTALSNRAEGLRRVAALAGCAAVLAGVVVLEGGDHFANYRFMTPLEPLAAAALAVLAAAPAAYCWREMSARGASPRAGVVLTAAGAVMVYVGAVEDFSLKPNIKTEFQIASGGLGYGERLRALRSRIGDFSMGVVAAGAAPYAFQGVSYDLEGLNWREMARSTSVKSGPRGHSSFDPAVFFRARPDLVVDALTCGAPIRTFILYPFTVDAMKDIFESPAFTSAYRPAAIDTGGCVVNVFASSRLIRQAERAGVSVKILPWSDVIIVPDAGGPHPVEASDPPGRGPSPP